MRLIAGVLLGVMLLGSGCTTNPRLASNIPEPAVPAPASQLSDQQLVSQLVLAGMRFSDVAQISTELLEYPLGGFLVHDQDTPTAGSLEELLQGLTNLYADMGVPEPLALVDQEGGEVQRLAFAGPATAQSAVATTEQATTLGEERGRALASLGIDVVLAPVLDVAQAGSAVETRAFTGSSSEVADRGLALIKGLHSQALAACPKHFPGLGSITEDTHISAAQLDGELETWRTHDALPFERVSSEVRCMLVAHVSAPWWGAMPSSLNRETVTYMREELGFEGALLTDDLAMGALDEFGSLGSRMILALEAGIDGLIVTGSQPEITAAIDEVVEALRDGRLDRDRLEDSLERLYALRT